MPSPKKRRGPGRPPKKKPQRKNTSRDAFVRINELDHFFREQFQDPDPSRRYLSYRKLAEWFRCGKNTVIHDIATMQATYNAPLEFIKERGGWGYTKEIANLPTIFVAQGDLTVVCASWGALDRRRNAAWSERVRPVMEKLMTSVSKNFPYDFKTISERIVFRTSGYHEAVDIGIFETVVTAVLSQHELRFVYRKFLEDGTEAAPESRHVQPRCIVSYENAYYVIADDPIRDGKSRTFALFRMDSAEATRIPFTPAGPFNLDDFLEHTVGIHGGGTIADVEVLFKPCVSRLVREHHWHKTEKYSIAPDGRLRLTMTVAVNAELEMKIQRWGSKAEVIAPSFLRDKFAKSTKELMQAYFGETANSQTAVGAP